MVKIIFLGTNGWYDTNTGNTVCVLIDTPSHTIILDAGNGIAKLDKYVDFHKPAYLFLSHFHLDHIVGLHTVSKYNFLQGLWICGQEGVASILGKIIDAPFTLAMKDFKYATRFVELPAQKDLLPFSITCLPLLHASPAQGYRFELGDTVVAYCSDTGYCDNAVKLSQNADLLITECAFQPGQEDIAWPHLNPETAAGIARESGAKRLALVHFDAEQYRTIEARRKAQDVARKIFPDTIATVDGMIIKV